MRSLLRDLAAGLLLLSCFAIIYIDLMLLAALVGALPGGRG